jgi:mutator protein MutT
MARAAAIIIYEGHVLLIRRQRPSETYYLFPGGRIELRETPEQALVRELQEELGLDIVAGRHIADIEYKENLQSYYVATLMLPLPNALTGDEAADAIWLPVEGLSALPVHPAAVAAMVEYSSGGWPDGVFRGVDGGRTPQDGPES